MKYLLFLAFYATLLTAVPAAARTVEVDVHGMTCGFCVDSLQRKFSKMDSVETVKVSLKFKKVRIETAENLPTIETIKKAVLDAGFTPVRVTVLK